jgi:hypothetical protein
MVLTKGVQTYKQIKVKVRQIVITNGRVCDMVTFAKLLIFNTKHNVKYLQIRNVKYTENQISTYIKCQIYI